MGKLLIAHELFTMKGRVIATSYRVCPRSTNRFICTCQKCPTDFGKVIDIQHETNSILSDWKSAMVSDLATGLTTSAPKAMAFSKSVVASSPTPTSLTSEFRSSTNRYSSSTTLQLVSVLGSTEGNSPSGNIKSMGFYFGSTATTTVGTGTLGSLINTLNVVKDPTIEVNFQYDITFT